MRRRISLNTAAVWIILAAGVIFFLFPIFWMVGTSFKYDVEYFTYPPVFFPSHLDLHNYSEALVYGAGQGLRDSLIVALTSTTLSMVIGSLTAYSISRFRTGGDSFSFWILSQRMLPPIAAVLPIFLLYREVKLLDTHLGLIIAYMIFLLPLVVWLMKGFFDDLPPEIEEAALIDGCTRWGALFRVALPLVAPGLVATAFFCFIFSWNEFPLALILCRNSVRTLPVVIPGLMGGHDILWGAVSAASVMAILPVIALSIILQRFLVRGLTLGAVKG